MTDRTGDLPQEPQPASELPQHPEHYPAPQPSYQQYPWAEQQYPQAYPPPTYPGQAAAEPSSRPARTVAVAALTAALVGGGVGAGTATLIANRDPGRVASLATSTQTAATTAKVDGTVSAAAAKIQPSVVTISVKSSQGSGTGSGVIIRSDGYILTNNHVVSVGAAGGSIAVVTDDGQQAPATIVGQAPSDDLAVIKVNALKNLTAATFAKSASLVVGQSVVAVGAPLGLSDTVTSGIVSNTARPVRSGDNDQAVFNAVQTDAAINPGNSGGPLVDLNGNVVGINAAIASTGSGGLQVPGQTSQSGNIGIGFAIPSDEATRIAAALISTGKAPHAVIGVRVTRPANAAGQSSPFGVTLSRVDTGSPAAKAGLHAGDVVTAVDKQRVQDADGLIAAVRSHAPGDTVTLTYTRGGTSATVQVTLGSAND